MFAFIAILVFKLLSHHSFFNLHNCTFVEPAYKRIGIQIYLTMKKQEKQGEK